MERRQAIKVLAFNCSPKMDNANTAFVLTPFLEGMRASGAEVELFYTRKLQINPCTGGLECWVKTPGECHHNDDMRILYSKLREADIWVFATPVYMDGMSGPMKNLIDRLIPLLEPFFELRNNHCRHPLRPGGKYGKVVLVTSCGYWEMGNFEPLLIHMKAACKNLGREFAGALLRPQGGVLRYAIRKGLPLDDIFKAAEEAGRQLIEFGQMSTETLKAVSRELMSRDEHIQVTNRGFQSALEKLEA